MISLERIIKPINAPKMLTINPEELGDFVSCKLQENDIEVIRQTIAWNLTTNMAVTFVIFEDLNPFTAISLNVTMLGVCTLKSFNSYHILELHWPHNDSGLVGFASAWPHEYTPLDTVMFDKESLLMLKKGFAK